MPTTKSIFHVFIHVVISKTFKVHLWYQHPSFGIQTSPWCDHDRRWRWPASPPGWSCRERFRRPGQTSSRRALQRWPESEINNIEPFPCRVCQQWLAKTYSFYDFSYLYINYIYIEPFQYTVCQLWLNETCLFYDYFYLYIYSGRRIMWSWLMCNQPLIVIRLHWFLLLSIIIFSYLFISYCYNSDNVIRYGFAQSDHIKRCLLYFLQYTISAYNL